MALNAPEQRDRRARRRKRAEMQPSDNEEERDDSNGTGMTSDDDGGEEEGSEGHSSEGMGSGGDEWYEEGGDSYAATAPTEQRNEQEESIGKRLSKLSHGVGPSRRKRRPRDERSDDQKPENAVMTEAGDGARKGAAALRQGKRDDAEHPGRPKAPRRANKNRPQEASSLRPVGRFREVVTTKRTTARDPRFEGGGGSSKLNYDIFRKAYGFLETYQDSEIEELKKALKKENNQERSARLQALLTRLQQERAERSQGDRTRAAIREAKKKEQTAVAGGKKPFFLRGSEKKRLALEQRYEGLKEEGKLSKFMEKKRKKNAAKDHRWLPSKRQDRG